MPTINYKRPVKNDSSELHICYRCSEEYSKYAPVALYSVLVNNTDRYVYAYIITDGISMTRWKKIQEISLFFGNNEIIIVAPDEEDVKRQHEKSISYHGWGLISISIYYQKYFSHLKKVFNFGIDSYCVGNLGAIWDVDADGYHLVGNCNRHQKRSWYKPTPRWIGMDISLINLEQLRKDSITPARMEDCSLAKVGYIHDEVAHNELCDRKYIDSDFYYIYTGSYLPRRKMHPKTRLVDYYNNLKPWEIAVRGYEVFDRYIEHYQAVAKIVNLEYELPKTPREVSRSLRAKGRPFVDWFPFSQGLIGELIYRAIWAWRYLVAKSGLLRRS